MEITKLYYTIGEVSEMLAIPASTIRHWETEISTLQPKKHSNGNRAFMKKDIELLQRIQYLITKGFTLDGVNKQINNNNKGLTDEMEVIQRLKRIRAFLVKLKSS